MNNDFKILMKQVCGILDLDGFQYKKTFIVREAAFIDIYLTTGTRVGFDLKEYNLNNRDLRTANYITNNITGLTIKPFKGEQVFPLGTLDKCIRDWYLSSKTETRNLIGFKGGCCENEILVKLGIPFLDLEKCGCPTFNNLRKGKDFPNCGYHLKDLHCALSEVYAFREWMLAEIYNIV